jgi:hypothetical protein
MLINKKKNTHETHRTTNFGNNKPHIKNRLPNKQAANSNRKFKSIQLKKIYIIAQTKNEAQS